MEKLNRYLYLSIISFFLLLIAQIANVFRQELFGIVPGYAPHNFSFNLAFFIPINLLALIIGIYVFSKTIKFKRKNKKVVISLLLSILPILLWIGVIILLVAY
jgi:hypothetical protein